jgi:hypothetical protein
VITALIPPQYRILARAIVLVGAAVSLFAWGWFKGSANVQRDWDTERLQTANAIAKLEAQQSQVTTKVITEYVDRVKIVREKGRTITNEVVKYVPSDTCNLPGGFRVLHDAAASNTLPDPAAASDAAAAPASTVATTVTENYAACHEIRAQLITLQDWITRQQGLSEHAD